MTDELNKYMRRIADNIEIDDSLPVDDSPVCETCNNLGMVYANVSEEHPYHNKLFPCPHCIKGQAEKQRILQSRIRKTELPAIYRQANLADWWQNLGSDEFRKGKRLAYLTAMEFLSSPDYKISSHAVAQRVQRLMSTATPQWINDVLSENDVLKGGFAFYGPVGTGKTYLAAGVMNALVEQGQLVLYMRAQDIISSLKATWNQKSDEETEDTVLERYKTAPFLFIDDMNLELRSGELPAYQKDYMEAIIRYRSNHELHTFITCNITLPQVYEQWGDRIADVLAADLQWVKMGGAHLRQTHKTWEQEL